MKKSHITLLSILFITIVFIGGVLLLKDNNTEQSKEKRASEVEETNTITYANGDFIYLPSHEDIGHDSEAAIFYFENILNLFLESKISDKQAEEFANTVDGVIVGRIKGAVNVLQLQVEAESFAELTELGDQFKDVELVKYAELSTPLYLNDLYDTSVEPIDTTKNNWWAEAINAYPAWDYVDNNPDKFKKVKVAVLESGKLNKIFRSIDADIKDSVSDDFSAWWTTYNNEHATLVTKIIAANNNLEKIRGVAAGVADIKFTAMGGNPIKEVEVKDADGKKVKDEEGNVINELLIISLIKSNLENGVKIINNSWGFPTMSEELWEETVDDDSELTHEKYKETEQKSKDKVSAQLIIAMNDLLNGKEKTYDFLIVQSAGNGYDRADGEEQSYDTGLEAKYTGSFANINVETYQKALELIEGNKLDSDLNKILDHIIVVGGAEQKTDGYQSPGWAGYGDAIDIVAPAEHLIIDNNKDWNGTSFSAPMVSGAAALLWSYNPTLTAPEVKDLLLKGSNMNAWDRDGEKKIYPMLNVTEALGLVIDDYEELSRDSNDNVSEEEAEENLCTIKDATESMELTSYHYDKLKETYITAISEEWDPSKLEEMDLGPVQYSPEPLPNQYGYELRDINDDGIYEMILGVKLEDGQEWIEEIYTLVDDTPIKIFASEIRHSAQIRCDGTIEENTVTMISEGVAETTYYELDKNGIKKMKDGYEWNGMKETYKSLIEPYGPMEENDLEELIQKYEKYEVIEHSFTPFVSDEK